MIQKGKRSLAAAPEASLSTAKPTGEPGLDRAIQSRIGDNLRAMYDELLQQPVPDRFRDLLGELDKTRSAEQKR
jgi:Anti-sigma factor NepR